MNKIADIIDTSWAAIDSAESILAKSTLMEYGDGDGLSMDEQERVFTKDDFKRDLRKVSRKIKK